MLDTLREILRYIHIPVGIAALPLMFVPLTLKKGGRAHRRFGWAFVWCMAIASVTAFALSVVTILRLHRDTGQLTLASIAMPVFLANVALLTGTSIHHGVRILRQKKRAGPHRHAIDLGLPLALVVFSLGTLGLAFATGNAVLLTLPVVGLAVGVQHFIAQVRPPKPMFWWLQHMAGMFGGCIAATTAALITNARYIRPHVAAPEWLYWIAPAAIGVPVLLVWQGVYRRKFANTRAKSA